MPRPVRCTTVTVAVAALAAAACPAPSARAAAPAFAPFASYDTGSGSGPGPAPVTTVALDADGDGRPDVATTTQFGQGPAVVLRNQGAGRFGAPSALAGSSGVQSLAAGDLDGDGRPDLVGMTSQAVVVLLNDGHGGFRPAGSTRATIGAQVQAIVTDATGDGRPDVVAMSFGSVQTLVNTGGGALRAGPTSRLPGAGALSAITEARIDPDAHRDLYAVDGFSGTVFALRGSATGAYSVSGRLVGAGFIPEDVNAVDLDEDGIDDVAAIGSFSFSVSTALGDGRGGFTAPFSSVVQSAGPGPTSVASADLDGDGHQDLVVSDVANPGRPSLLVLAGDGSVKPQPAGELPVAAFPQNPAVADYDGDGRPDIAVAGPGSLSVLLNRTS